MMNPLLCLFIKFFETISSSKRLKSDVADLLKEETKIRNGQQVSGD